MGTASKIDAYLRRHGSPLAGLGHVFEAEGAHFGVNPYLLVAIAGAESSFGKFNSGAHNAWGWGPGKSFGSWQDGIAAIAHGLRSGYLDQGLKSVTQIGSKWAPAGASNDPTNLNSNWTKNVSRFLKELGASMPTGGPVSPSQPTGGANTSSGMGLPDPSSAALSTLGDISSGSYNPLHSLSSLVDAVAAGAGSSGPTLGTSGPPEATSLGSSKGGITFSGQKLTHQTDGLPGYPAVDIFAKAGTPFLAPESGKVIRLSGRGGTSGNVFGYSVYFQGDSGKTYFITHLQPGRPTVGTRVRRGGVLGRVSPWKSGSSHAHVGIHG